MYRTLSFVVSAAVVSAALAATAFAPIANAQDRVAEQTHVTVKAADLATPADVRMTYRRIEAAAKRVCDSDDSSVMTQQADKACETQAISDTLQSLDAPQLSALDPVREHRQSTEMAFAPGHYTTR